MTSAATASFWGAGVAISFDSFSATSTAPFEGALELLHLMAAESEGALRAATPLRATARRDMVVERQGSARRTFLVRPL